MFRRFLLLLHLELDVSWYRWRKLLRAVLHNGERHHLFVSGEQRDSDAKRNHLRLSGNVQRDLDGIGVK